MKLNPSSPLKPIFQLWDLGLCSSLCYWIHNFLIGRLQSVLIGNNTSSLTICTGNPRQHTVPLFYTNDCVASHCSNTIFKFADDTTIVVHATGNNESAYMREIRNLVEWFQNKNRTFSFMKTKALIVDFMKGNLMDHALTSLAEWWRRKSTTSTSLMICPGSSILCNHKECSTTSHLSQRLRRLGMSVNTLIKCIQV